MAGRAPQAQLLDIIRQLGGLQAQLMSAAGLQLWSRIEPLSPADISKALWQERTVVKTWAMRGTLHLLTASDLGLFVAARRAFPKGWISPVVLIGGRLAGVWEYDRQRSPITVTIELFAPVQAETQVGIEAETRRLGDFWDDNIEIQFHS